MKIGLIGSWLIIYGSEVKIHMDKENSHITQEFYADVNKKGIKPLEKISAHVHSSSMDVLMNSEMGRKSQVGECLGK